MPTSMQGERVPLVTTPTVVVVVSTAHPARGMPCPVKTNGASFSSVPCSACSRSRVSADEVGVERARPLEPGLDRRALGAESRCRRAGSRPPVAACRARPGPQGTTPASSSASQTAVAVARLDQQLDAVLARVAGAAHERRRTRDRRLGVAEAIRDLALLGPRPRISTARRPLQREHRVLGGDVGDLHPVEAVGLPREPVEVAVGVGRVHDGQEALLAVGRGEPVGEQVVQHAAVLAAQQRVLRAARLDLADVVGQQVLEELGGARPARRDLAHVRDVEDAGAGAHRDVLLAHALVLHRHLPARERNHARARAQHARRAGASCLSAAAVADKADMTLARGLSRTLKQLGTRKACGARLSAAPRVSVPRSGRGAPPDQKGASVTIDHEQRRLHRRGRPGREVRRTFETALFEVKRVIVGQEEMLERVFVALLADGHVLLEGVPGLAKTMTIKAASDVLGGSFKRIQFTPDLVPSDLVGTRIYRADSGTLRHRAGPGVLQLPAGRRDQPRAREGPVRAARGDAGAPGHDRARTPSGRPTRSSCSRRRTRSSRRARTRCPEAQVDRFMFKVVIDYPSSETRRSAVVTARWARRPTSRRCSRRSSSSRLSSATRGGVRGPRGERVRGRARGGDPGPRASTGSTRPQALHRVRRQPARVDQPDPRRAGARAAARPRVRAARGRASRSRTTCCATGSCSPTRRWPRASTPTSCWTRCSTAVPHAGGLPVANGGRVKARLQRSSLKAAPARAPDAARPGPGPTPTAVLRALDLTSAGGSTASSPASIARLRSAHGTELAQVRPYQLGDDVRQIDWAVTARTSEPHVRVHVAERTLTTWLLLDGRPR